MGDVRACSAAMQSVCGRGGPAEVRNCRGDGKEKWDGRGIHAIDSELGGEQKKTENADICGRS